MRQIPPWVLLPRFEQTGSTSPSAGSIPAKKDPLGPQQTPIERALKDAGPLRDDGSDKFWGMENFGSTCYCNSILQCLYYSAPFREHVISYPKRTPIESLNTTTTLPRLNTAPGNVNAGSPPPRNRPPVTSPGANPTRKSLGSNPTAGQPGIRPEDNPNTQEYKKKQAVLAGPIVRMEQENAGAYGMSESLFTAMKDLYEVLVAHKSRTGIIAPVRFYDILKTQNETFASANHQDAHEFLNHLLNDVVTTVETNTKRMEAEKTAQKESDRNEIIATPKVADPSTRSPTSTGWVHDLFEGTLTSETKCLTCENISQRDEVFLDLSVDTDEDTSVTACLMKFSQEEMLCERNKFHCDNCGGLQEAEKRMKIKRLPRILALHLKRFKYTEDLQRLHKLFHRIVYPFSLRLFNTTDDAEDPDRLYELYAVVVHIGNGPYHGHYVTVIKTEDRGWLLFDDESVEPVDKSYVENFFGDKPGQAAAYILFYQETTLEAMEKSRDAESKMADKAAESAKASALAPHVKQNGVFANGGLFGHNNPGLLAKEADQLAGLNAVASPPAATTNIFHEAVSTTTPAEIPMEKLDSKSKKVRAREEKEAKAREKQEAKDKEAAEKARVKEEEFKRKDLLRKQKDDMKIATQLSKQTKAEEDGKFSQGLGSENGHTIANHGLMHNSLSRFKEGSKSIKHRKLFGSRDKDPPESRDSSQVLKNVFIPPDTVSEGVENMAPLPEKQEKPRSGLFTLRKKPSILS
ncbi:MAG: hypothetical protein M1824_001905 [Vezdaea acicularis]|nr:MAG: hypothetical protein M1824_001905 [Vezdaea acicularis]